MYENEIVAYIITTYDSAEKWIDTIPDRGL